MKSNTRVGDLRDIRNITISLVVEGPVPSLGHPPGKLLDCSDDVEIKLVLPGGVTLSAMIDVREYQSIAKGHMDAVAKASSLELVPH